MSAQQTGPLLEDCEIPVQFKHEGRTVVVIDRMRNYHTRALVLPACDGPFWVSNEELRAAIAKQGGAA